MESEYVPGSNHAYFLETDMDEKKNCLPAVEERWKYKDVPLLVCHHNWLTPEGEAFLKRLEQQRLLTRIRNYDFDEHQYESTYFVKIGDPVVNVTGIVKDENHATVDFCFTFTHLTEMGRVLFPDNQYNHCEDSHQAEFTRYDDGWRVTKLDHPVWSYGAPW